MLPSLDDLVRNPAELKQTITQLTDTGKKNHQH